MRASKLMTGLAVSAVMHSGLALGQEALAPSNTLVSNAAGCLSSDDPGLCISQVQSAALRACDGDMDCWNRVESVIAVARELSLKAGEQKIRRESDRVAQVLQLCLAAGEEINDCEATALTACGDDGLCKSQIKLEVGGAKMEALTQRVDGLNDDPIDDLLKKYGVCDDGSQAGDGVCGSAD